MTPASIGRYVVQGELGRGSMGVVYRALDPRLRRAVAIKLVLPTGDRTRLLRRLSVEAVALGRLRHEGIVTLHEVGEHEGNPYLVMDLVEGRSLQERLDTEGPMPPREAARVARLVALALAHAHARGVLHRDVKPSNVLLTRDGGAVLTDFGLARDSVAASGVSQAGNMLGTPGFWPPEQARGKVDEIGPVSDVYALGATLFAMLTGQPPFVLDTFIEAVAAACSTPAPAPSSLERGVDRALDAITLKTLEKDPADRHASADALAADLERYLQVGDVSDRAGRRKRASKAPRPAVIAGGALVVGLALLASFGVIATRSEPADGSATPAAVDPSLAPVASAITTAPAPRGLTQAARSAYLKGLALQLKAQYDPARVCFDAALADAPDLAPALQRRALCLAALGDRLAALADLARAIELQGAWDAAPWFYRAGVRGAVDDDAGAAEDLTTALALAPESVSTALGRALVLVVVDRVPDALEGLTALIERRPDVWTASYYRGWARARRAGDLTGGVEDMTRVIVLAPRANGAWRERAWCRMKLEDPGAARSDLDRALELDPTDIEAFDLRAEVCGQLNDAAAMERDAAEVIRLDPERASGWCDRSTARLLQRDLAGAMTDVEEALRRDPAWSWAVTQRGRLRALVGDRAAAIADFTRAAATAPTDDYHPLWLAGLGKPDPARLEKLAASSSWLASLALRALGRATDDEVLAVVTAAETATKRRERACVVTGFLGLFAERDGDRAAARKHYRACLDARRPMWAQHQWAVNRLAALGP